MTSYSFSGMKFATLVLIGLMSFSTLGSSALAYTNTSTRYSAQKAATYVDGYVARLQRAGYSTSQMTNALISLRSLYIKREKSGLYTGSALYEIQAVIDELDSAIAGVSEGTCGTCGIYDQFNVYVPPPSTYTPPYNNYNPYTPPTYSNQSVRVSDVSLSNDGYSYTETRTNLTRDNSYNSYKEYDVYTFSLQSNGYTSNQPTSSRFLSTSLSRQFSTRQGRNLSVYFGSTLDYNSVRNIRSTAQNSYKSSQTTLSTYSTFIDTFTSLSPDEFSRQAVSNGYNQKSYRTYKLYIAKDDSQAFIVEYLETGTGNGSSYSQNISGIDTASFSDSSTYFSHTYRTTNGYSKRYKQYIYIPQAGMSPSSVQSNLGMSYRTSYQMGASRNLYVNNNYTTTTINGYTVNSGYVSSLESTFSSYGYASYVTLPGSNSQIIFSPRSGYDFQYSKLSDNTYRTYRLLVAEDGSDAYLTEYIQSTSNYYY